MTVLVVALGGTAYAAWRLNANITKLDVSAAIGTDRPTQAPEAADAVNILLIGSDTREGAGNDAYADRDGTLGGGAHSDTNLLVHLSADRSTATRGVDPPRLDDARAAELLGHRPQGRVAACGSGTRTTRSAARAA